MKTSFVNFKFPMITKSITQKEHLKLSKKELNGKFKIDGDVYHLKNGRPHRLDGPAIEYSDGGKDWYKNGKLHRLDGPASTFEEDEYYFINGKEYSYEEWKILSFAILNNLKYFL